MKPIRITYIDNEIDTLISAWLSQYFNVNSAIVISEEKFESSQGYEYLLNRLSVREANIILIDDILFENRSVHPGSVTGEELKLLLKKFLPFTETFVVTQNDGDERTGTILKFRPEIAEDKSPDEYYDEILRPKLDEAVIKAIQYQLLLEKFEQSPGWDIAIKQQIANVLEGKDTYDALKKADIDALIQAFHELERQIANEH